jgi:alanine racemase
MLRWAEIHLDRLLRNFEKVKKLANKEIYAVVKANGYGHGSVEVSKFLERETSVYGFCVATYEEGAQLREAGIKKPILVMSSTLSEGVKYVKEYKLTPVVYDFEELKIAKKLGVPFHLKIDTGMGRLGFLERDFKGLLEEIEGTKLKGIMTHFSSADEDEEYTKKQLEIFKIFLSAARKGFKNLEIHAENSAALRLKINSFLTHCRAGISLYGAKPCKDYPELEQVMEVKAKVLTVKELPKDFYVSYSKTYKTKEREKVAVVSIGYADGYPRELSNKGKILINGKFCPVRGRVCMDMTVVSVEGTEVKKGDVATVFGKGITFEKVSREINKIPYELMCAVSQRVRRVYVGLQESNL